MSDSSNYKCFTYNTLEHFRRLAASDIAFVENDFMGIAYDSTENAFTGFLKQKHPRHTMIGRLKGTDLITIQEKMKNQLNIKLNDKVEKEGIIPENLYTYICTPDAAWTAQEKLKHNFEETLYGPELKMEYIIEEMQRCFYIK